MNMIVEFKESNSAFDVDFKAENKFDVDFKGAVYVGGSEGGSYNEGYADGYNKGNADGQAAGYNTGYSEGQTAGYNSGYSEGESKGYADGEQAGHQAGYTEGYTEGSEQGVADYKDQYVSDLWDRLQPNGAEPTLYQYQFCGETWTDDIFKPKYDIVTTTYGNTMFARCKLTDLREQTLGVKIDFSRTTSFAINFQGCFNPMLIDEIDTRGCSSLVGGFLHQSSFKYIGKIIFKDDGSQNINASNFMTQITELEEVRFEGKFGATNANLSSSTRLTVESLVSLFECLKDYSSSSTTYTIRIGSTNKAKLTDEQLDIAYNKGWTVN